MKAEGTIRLMVVDDHPLVHQGVAAVAASEDDMEFIGAARNVEEGLRVLEAEPDIALVDLRLPGESGLDLIRKGRQSAPGCRFIVLTSVLSAAAVREAMDLSVEGYVLKDALPDEMLAAIRRVARGRPYMDPAVMEMLFSPVGPLGGSTEPITERQRDVLIALGRGLGTAQMATTLNISESTVKKHISEILAKLGLADRTQAALYAVARGLVQVDELAFTGRP